MNIAVEKQKKVIADLDKTIETLLATRNELAGKLNKEVPLLNQLLDLSNKAVGTWVILKNKNMYYQFNGVGSLDPNTNVGLMRNGQWSKISASELNKNYRMATPIEVKQHLEFLQTKQVTSPLIKVKGEVYNNKPSFDPMKCDFYLVTCRGIRGAKVRHTSYEIAEAEAKKIAEKENHETWVLGVVASVKPIVETVKKVSVQVNKR